MRGIDKLGDGRFRGRFMHDGKRYTTPIYRTQKDALTALTKARSEVQRGVYVDPRRAGITLDEWMGMWMPNRANIRSYVLDKEQARYDLHIKPYLGGLSLAALTPYQIETWLSKLARDGRRPPTIRKAHSLLRTALGPRGAMGDGRRASNPCQVVPAPRSDKPEWSLLTQAQFAALLDEMPEEYRPLLLVAAYTGLRWSEIAGLRRKDFNPLRAEITVRRPSVYHKGRLYEGEPKTGRRRTVPLLPEVLTALNEQAIGKGSDDHLFTGPRGGALRHPHFMERVYKPARLAAGLPAVRFHDLRHSCASWLLAGGADLALVQEVMGHSSIATTQLYLHVDQERKREAMVKALRG